MKLISDDDWNIISGEEKKVNVLNDNNNNLYKNRKLPSISSSKINLNPKLYEIILKNLIKNLPKIKNLTNNNTTTSTPKLGKFNTINHSKKEEKKNEIKEEKKNKITEEKKDEEK